MKAGKFNKKTLGYQIVAGRREPTGKDSPVKKIWFGQLELKANALAAADNINLRGATWGFSRIDYALIWPLKPSTGKAIGAGFGAGIASCQAWASTRVCTVQAGATLAATPTTPIMGFIYGQ